MRTRGFTLIELAVAIFITAVLFAIGYGAVNQAVNNREALESQQQRLLEVQTAMRVIGQDVAQLALRPTRNPSGNTMDPVLQTTTTQPFLMLTRGGWANPAGVQRPALQRVAYWFENNTLRREYWPVLDPLLSVETHKRELLTNVRSVTVRYMDITRQWRDTWPPQSVVRGNAQQSLRVRPVAIEVTFDLEDWGKVTRIFEVPT